jgi:hypothetical protein
MKSLRDELLSEPLRKNLVEIRGKRFTIIEVDDAEMERLMSSCRRPSGKWIDESMPDGKLLSRCVRDENEQEVFGMDEWQEWKKLGRGWTGALRREVLKLNSLDEDDVGREVKNSDTAASSV